MRRPLFIAVLPFAAAAGLALAPGGAAGQGVVMQKSLSLGLAKTIAEAALADPLLR